MSKSESRPVFPTIQTQSPERRSEQVDPERIFGWIREKKTVSDIVFDSIYPQEYQDLSSVHWTPIRVIRRVVELAAVELATETAPVRILDVGSGVGKFCLIGALIASEKAQFLGIEQRRSLFEIAHSVVRRHGIQGASYLHGNAFDLDWNDFDFVYLFNPFSENIDSDLKIDGSVPLGSEIFEDYVERTREKLDALELGKRVLIYNGFGGEMPDGFSLLTSDVFSTAKLDCWEKISAGSRS